MSAPRFARGCANGCALSLALYAAIGVIAYLTLGRVL